MGYVLVGCTCIRAQLFCSDLKGGLILAALSLSQLQD